MLATNYSMFIDFLFVCLFCINNAHYDLDEKHCKFLFKDGVTSVIEFRATPSPGSS